MAKKLQKLNYTAIYNRVLLGLEDNKKLEDKYKHNKNYLKGLQLAEEKQEHQTVVEYILPIIYTHLPNILPASFNCDVEYSIDKEQRNAWYSKMLLKDLYKRKNYYYQFLLALLDVLTFGIGWTHQTYRTLYKPNGSVWMRLPIIERVSPVDMLWDRTGYHFEFGVSGCINWVARRIRRPTEEIMMDERYNKNKKKLEGKGHSIISDKERKAKDLEKIKGTAGLKQSELYEVYLIPERRLITFADELTADDYLRDEEAPYENKYNYVIPFAMCKGYEIPDEFLGRSEADITEGTQDELNLLRGYLLNYFFRMLPTWLFQQGKINEDQKKRLESGDFGMFIEVSGRGVVDSLPIPPIPLGAMISHTESIKREDIPLSSGLSEYQMSKIPRGEQTATAVLEASSGGRPRTTIKKNFFTAFMNKSLNNLLQILQMKMKGNYPITYPVAEMGMGKKIVTEYLKKEHIQGNLNVVVDIADERSIDEQMKRKEKLGALKEAYALNPENMETIEVQKEIMKLGGYDNVELWFPTKTTEEEIPTEETMPMGETPPEIPEIAPTEAGERSPVVENLAQRGAYTQHRAGAFGGIADQIRKLLGRK